VFFIDLEFFSPPNFGEKRTSEEGAEIIMGLAESLTGSSISSES